MEQWYFFTKDQVSILNATILGKVNMPFTVPLLVMIIVEWLISLQDGLALYMTTEFYLRNTQLFKNKAEYFGLNEYLLGDSAYSSSQIMVQALKKNRGQYDLPIRKKRFNTLLAEVRIKSEHCIGILKGQFPCLRRINVLIRKGRRQLKYIVDIVTVCIILHNLMINYKDKIPQEWYNEINKEINWDIYDDHNIDNDMEIDRRNEVFKHIQKFYLWCNCL